MATTLTGTIVFNTVGRPQYGFDVFSVNLQNDPPFNISMEHRLTDGTSVNFNAQFIEAEEQSIVFISERTGASRIYITGPENPTQTLGFVPESRFNDRPIIRNGKLYFVSAHEEPNTLFKSSCAIYSTSVAVNGS